MESDSAAFPPERKVQNRDVAESNQRLWVAAGRFEIQPVCDPVGALAASRRKDRAHARILQSIVDIRQPGFIAASQVVAEPVKGVSADLNFQPPRF